MQKMFIVIILILLSQLNAAKMPDFVLENSQGEEIGLYETLNDTTVVIVDFWATWCGPCVLELPHLDTLQAKYKNLEVLAISTDGKKTMPRAIEFIKENGYKFSVLHDPGRKVQRLLDVKAIPVTFLVAPDGEIHYEHTGYEAGDEVKLEKQLKILLDKLGLITE